MGKDCVDQGFILRHIGEKTQENFFGFMDLEKPYYRVNIGEL